MTRNTLKHEVYKVISMLFVILFVGILSWKSSTEQADYFDLFKSSAAILIGALAAWLTFCFQRRTAFVKTLADYWPKLVESVQDAIDYTRLDAFEATRDRHAKVLRQLSCSIDNIRGIFRNINEQNTSDRENFLILVFKIKISRNVLTDPLVNSYCRQLRKEQNKNIGLYPFESLKQIYTVLECLSHKDDGFSKPDAKQANAIINILWKGLRAELLREFDRDTPQFPDTPFSKDKKTSPS